MRFPFLNRLPSSAKFCGFCVCVLHKPVQIVEENTVDFPSEQVIGKPEGLVACPENESPLLLFVLRREHQNESHVFFQNFNVLEVSNSKAVPIFFRTLFEVFETSSHVTLGISSSSNTSALFRNSILCFSYIFFQDAERMGKTPMVEIALKFTEIVVFQTNKHAHRLVPHSF